MKGVKYNLILTNLIGDEIKFEKLSMNDSIKTISKFLIDNYSVQTCVTKHTIYNLLHQRGGKKTLLRQKCKINKYCETELL